MENNSQLSIQEIVPKLQKLSNKYMCKCVPYKSFVGFINENHTVIQGYEIIPTNPDYKYDSLIIYFDKNNYNGVLQYQVALHHIYQKISNKIPCTETNLSVIFKQYFKHHKNGK